MGEIEKEISDKDLKKLLSLVKSYTGITMEERKRDILSTRIRPQLRRLNMQLFEEYINCIQSNPVERQKFINLATTNETHFFRTEAIWKYFELEYLPEWWKKNSSQTLRVWSAASSSGAEAYSIMMLCEEFRTKNPGFKYRVYGSDICTDVLEVATNATYTDKVLAELKTKKPLLHQKYFDVLSLTQSQVKEEYRKNVEFGVHHLHTKSNRKDFYDITFLRNVMIYFSEPDQEMVLRHMKESLKKDGVLILGESESLARLKSDFTFAKPLIYLRAAA